jgi:hypothetical protein
MLYCVALVRYVGSIRARRRNISEDGILQTDTEPGYSVDSHSTNCSRFINNPAFRCYVVPAVTESLSNWLNESPISNVRGAGNSLMHSRPLMTQEIC